MATAHGHIDKVTVATNERSWHENNWLLYLGLYQEVRKQPILAQE